MLNRYKAGDEVEVFRDVYPLALSDDRSGVVKSFYFDNNYNTHYLVKWREHEIVCTEKEITEPCNNYKYERYYRNRHKDAVIN